MPTTRTQSVTNLSNIRVERSTNRSQLIDALDLEIKPLFRGKIISDAPPDYYEITGMSRPITRQPFMIQHEIPTFSGEHKLAIKTCTVSCVSAFALNNTFLGPTGLGLLKTLGSGSTAFSFVCGFWGTCCVLTTIGSGVSAYLWRNTDLDV